jgi:hypothetical protein
MLSVIVFTETNAGLSCMWIEKVLVYDVVCI